ncbi:uncharacterized protein LOC129792837 isoform X1 [Lutzomyia longipalpis]|uniref:uncharacterized protein LOC129792837 isoform X1 n=1 Tax=Lutzomyia longipalpis TaxID=7200 RepID=UPI0024839122|nr:uncharacterized protein LOC129792837 isoform X1 [Lutzomyia longipalpis]
MTVSVTHGQTTTTTTHPHPSTTATMVRPTSPGNSSGSETDQVTGTALRRLYFKSGRHPRARGPAVPKVVVMGSSTTSNSEATINTSTESASTLTTNVTATDTETCDSLDFGDTSGLMEPLLSSLDEAPTTAISVQSPPPLTNGCAAGEDKEQRKAEEAEVGNRIPSPAPDPPLLLNYDEDPSNQPKTAPVSTQSRFPFDRPPSPRSVRTLEKNQPLFTFDEEAEHRESRHRDQISEKEKKCDKTINGRVALKDKYVLSKRMSAKKRFGQTDSTMFPFDREALDYERIQREYFALEEETKFPFDSDTCLGYNSSDSPLRESIKRSEIELKDRRKYEGPQDVFQQYTLLAQQESKMHYTESTPKPTRRSTKRVNPGNYSSKYDAFSPKTDHPKSVQDHLGGMSKFDQIATKFDQMAPKGESSSPSGGAHGTPLPDLRVDFFAEEPTARADDVNLEDCQKIMQRGDAINVTSNPLDSAVCTQPRATIVVQQASLSLDNSVETFLLKHETDFVSVEQGKEARQKKKQQREENMRQLLDVTNTLTSEEIRDFEMRYGSPHHSRSQSVKTPGSRASGRPNQLSLPQQRSRVASMPNTGVEEEYYRLRHFSITGKGVVNRGDSLKSRRSRSNNSVASSNSSTEHLTANAAVVVSTAGGGSAKTSATASLASSRESSTSNPGNGPYRVLMLGATAVGKSSLVSQFMTSEYLHAYDTSIDDESGEKSVSVLLSGEESELIFIDHASTDMSPESCLTSYDPHGYCVIYSSADRCSFLVAERVLQGLWTSENIAQKAVILVANKADLARSRAVSSEEGKAMATAYDCKFIETSVGINHNVDELLVGLLSQIRLKLENPEKSRDLFRKRSTRKSKRRACSPLGSAATACLTGSGGTNPGTPVSIGPTVTGHDYPTPPGSAQSSPRKYRGSRTSTSLKVKGLLGRVWARDSKSKSCENLHVL